nr:hypothetical protein [Rhodococcus sp. (in: high G+C Gram-positive bacteria)]
MSDQTVHFGKINGQNEVRALIGPRGDGSFIPLNYKQGDRVAYATWEISERTKATLVHHRVQPKVNRAPEGYAVEIAGETVTYTEEQFQTFMQLAAIAYSIAEFKDEESKNPPPPPIPTLEEDFTTVLDIDVDMDFDDDYIDRDDQLAFQAAKDRLLAALGEKKISFS